MEWRNNLTEDPCFPIEKNLKVLKDTKVAQETLKGHLKVV